MPWHKAREELIVNRETERWLLIQACSFAYTGPKTLFALGILLPSLV